MALLDLAQPKTGGLKGLAGLSSSKTKTGSFDLDTVEGLTAFAESQGLKIPKKEKKLSFLQRLGAGLGAFNPAEAIATGIEKKSVGAGLLEYPKSIVQGLGSAITGKNFDKDRRFFKDIAEDAGIENNIAKFGLGFLGDVLLDPTTYFGGAIARGVGATVKGASKGIAKGIGKASPEAELGLELIGTGLKDALGRAFSFGYKSSKGAKEDVLTFLSKEQKAKAGLAGSNLDRLGTGVLNESQRQELALKMIAGKRAEFAARGESLSEKAQIRKQLEGLEVAIEEHPAKSLARFANKNGELPEVLGKGKSNFGRLGDDFTNELGFEDSEQAREAYQQFRGLQASRKELKERLMTASDDVIIDTEFAGQIGKDVAQSSDPVVQKTIEEQIARSKKFGEGLGLENPYEVYFPFIKNDKVQRFLNETRGIKVGSEGYKKQFKNLLTNENLELDPAKAFFTRESQIVSDRMTRDFLEGYVKKYGKGLDEFQSTDDALKNGYVLIKEKGNFGKELGYVSKYDGALIRDAITPEFQTINMLAKATGFDTVTSLFKRSVTGLFAPFHVRNFVSGNIQNFEVLGPAVFNPKNIAAGQKIAYIMARGEKIPKGSMSIGGKTMQFDEVMKPFMDRFSGDTFYTADFDLALKSGSELKSVAGLFSKGRINETIKTVGLGQEAIPFKVGRAIGQFIEHQQKATSYVTALGQGKNIDEALRLAEAAGFDYRALTRFESQIMRRIIPFYSFTRKNIELQLKTLGENPQRINQVLKFFGNIGETMTEEEKENLPDFIQESIGIKLKDTPEGLKQYVSSFGTPIEAFTQLFGSNPVLRAMSTMNPLLKVPIEIGIGKDSFRQRDLKDVYTANEYKKAPQIIKDLLQIEEVTKPIFKTINGKAVKVGEKTVHVADPVRLLIARSLFTSRGVTYLDQLFGGDLEGFIKVLKTTTGIKPQQVDIEAQKFFNERDKRRALEDLLERYGAVKRFSKTYIPKE